MGPITREQITQRAANLAHVCEVAPTLNISFDEQVALLILAVMELEAIERDAATLHALEHASMVEV